MNTYKFTDGFEFEANTPLAIVESLRISGMFTAQQDTQTYMTEFAKRADELYGIVINCDDAESFVLDLMSNNLLLRVD